MSLIEKYRTRLLRKQRLVRAYRRGHKDLSPVVDRTKSIEKNDILLFACLRDERARLDFFLEYYRKLGVNHFCFVDNGSKDGSGEFLKNQPDCSIWHTNASYKRAGFGMHWLNFLMNKKASKHWCVVVDIDEFFIYPHCDSRPLSALTDSLDAASRKSFGALLLDLYPKQDLADAHVGIGESPIEAAPYFDSGNYGVKYNERFHNLWIQGGVRQRAFFEDKPDFAPALNKIPLVKWKRGNIFFSSTHTLLPRSLNRTYCQKGTQRASGVLLHTKLVSDFAKKVENDETNLQHYAQGREYEVYKAKKDKSGAFYTAHSTRFEGWKQLEDFGLMSRGNWA